MLRDLVMIVVCYDLWFYAAHRLLHSSTYLAPYHKIHHQKDHEGGMTFWEAGIAHPVENLLTNIGFILPVLVLSPPILASILGYLFISIRGLLRHDQRASRWIGKHHLIHHHHPHCNYSSYPIDLLFGTAKKHSLEN